MSQDRKWVFIRSWHAVRTPTRMFNTYVTLCGRRATASLTADELPAGKSCEVCLRIVARQDDVPFDFSTMSREPA